MICAQCKAEQPDGNRFCGQCGASMAAQVQAPEPQPQRAAPATSRRAGERRQMTILFYDLVGSTALATRCDPEDFSEAMETFHSRVGTAIRGVGGHVGARVGDGAVVYFGYPDAQEDAAERAVLAGLRAVEVGGEVVLPDGEKAQVRIGIATGQGVVSRLEHDGGGNEVVGSVGNLAARLQSAAGPGNVVISEATRRLLRERFELVDLGGVEAKGFSEPVRAWRVAGRTERDPADGVGEAPLIGRAEPLERIAAALEEIRDGPGRVILVTGDAGMGKSRLVAEVGRRAAAEHVLRMSVFCSTQLQEAPFGPFIQQMRRTNRIDVAREGGGAGGSSGAPATLKGLAPGTDPDDAALLGALFGFPVAESPAVLALTPAQRRDRRIEALIQQLSLFSKLSPVLLIVEDAQWADATSRSVLDRAVHAGRLDRTLILVTARPGFRPSWLAESHVEEIALSPLHPGEAEALVYMIAGYHALTPSVGRAILDRADGVPLFIEEITRSAMEQRLGARNDPAAEQDLPTTLQDTMLARLDRLGPAKAVAQVAAAIGRRFTRGLLESLNDPGGETLHPFALAAALRQLIASGLIAPERTDQTGRDRSDAYVFKHAVFQETAYGTLLRADRRRLNARLLEVIERDHPALVEAEPERLAHYATEAGAAETAAAYWLKAGVQAMAQWAMPEAATRLRRGLAAVGQLTQQPARWRLELRLELSLGRALIATVGYALPETGATFVRAKALCEAIGQKVELAAVVHGLWIHDLLCGRLDSSRLHALTLLRMAEEDNNPSWVLVAYRALGALGFPSGQFAEGEQNLKHGLSLFSLDRRAEYAQILVDDPRVVMLMYLSWVLLYQGRKDEAEQAVAECVGQARALGQAYNMAYALVGHVMVGLFQDQYDGLWPFIEELSDLAREQEIDYFAAVGEISRGRYLVGTGEIESGAKVIEAALATYRATGSILYLPTFILWTADALARVGRCDQAMDLLHEARALMEQTGMANDLAEVLRVEGELCRSLGDTAKARADFEAALQAVDRYGTELHRGRVLASLAALDRGEPGVLGYADVETAR
jgi:class 3 adenylate cyclase/tetratricopeptide (TPR) repeat protein